MNPFDPAIPDPGSVERTRAGLVEKALSDPDWLRRTLPALSAGAGKDEIEREIDGVIHEIRQNEATASAPRSRGPRARGFHTSWSSATVRPRMAVSRYRVRGEGNLGTMTLRDFEMRARAMISEKRATC